MMPEAAPQIEPSWKEILDEEFQKPYFRQIKMTLVEEKKKGFTIYPPGPLIFNAFNLTPFDEVKVVILGQDPYHGKGQAHGLCFSVPQGIAPPPSLVNIFKELHDDLGVPLPNHGNLEKWARQGVFLLNAILTVRDGEPASHSKIGWQDFTNSVINKLSTLRAGIVFLLWGKFAQEKEILIDGSRHHILKAAHPSPYSASGFFGCRHFSATNKILQHEGYNPIDWKLD
ncbi:MAG TPA: uracil-DNA glycosylase [Chitinophagales bacterium]|nr:uracil-DNA glycosylase [Chitinophagales bacterium]